MTYDLRTLADGAADAWDDAPEAFKPILRDCSDALIEAADGLDRLRAYVEADCHCPCCEETRHCMSGCTFRDDSQDGWERMVAARKAMWGGDAHGRRGDIAASDGLKSV